MTQRYDTLGNALPANAVASGTLAGLGEPSMTQHYKEEETMDVEITERSKALFVAYAKDAGNWSGTPLVGGNVGGSKEDRGNLTQLKRAGLIQTHAENDGTTWVIFTEAGIAYAATLGIVVPPYGLA